MSKILLVLAIFFSVIALTIGTNQASAHEDKDYVYPLCEVTTEIEVLVQKERKVTYTIIETGGQYTNAISYPKKQTRLVKHFVPCVTHETNAPPYFVTWEGIRENEDKNQIYISGNFAVDPNGVIRFTKPSNEPQRLAMVAHVDGSIGFNGVLVVNKDTQTVNFAGHNVGYYVDGDIIWKHEGIPAWPKRAIVKAVVLPDTWILIDVDD